MRRRCSVFSSVFLVAIVLTGCGTYESRKNHEVNPPSRAPRDTPTADTMAEREVAKHLALASLDACKDGLDAYKDSVFKLVRANCSRCHDPNGLGADKGPLFAVDDAEVSYGRVIRYQNFDDIAKSIFVTYGGGGHCLTKYDYDCKTKEDDVKAAATAWWDNGEKTCPRKGKFFTPPKSLPTNVPSRADGFMTVRWDLSAIGTDFKKAVFELEVQKFADASEESTGALRFRRPRIASPTKALHVGDIKVLVNGKFDTLANGFMVLDGNIAPLAIPTNAADPLPHAVLTGKTLIVLNDKGATDEISVSFEKLEVTAAPACQALTAFTDKVKPVMVARNCFACHGGGPANETGTSPANKRLSMALADSALCAALLQRVDRKIAMNSPLVEYPLKGIPQYPLNAGHARIFTGQNEVVPAWLDWMKAEFPAAAMSIEADEE